MFCMQEKWVIEYSSARWIEARNLRYVQPALTLSIVWRMTRE